MGAFHRALGGDAEVHAWPWGNAEVHAWPWGNAAFGSAAAPREVASFCCKNSHVCLLTGGARRGGLPEVHSSCAATGSGAQVVAAP